MAPMSMWSRVGLSYGTKVLFTLFLCVAQQCAAQNLLGFDFSNIQIDFSQPGCLGQKTRSSAQCFSYTLGRKYCCGDESLGSATVVTPICKYWYNSLSAPGSNSISIDSLRSRQPISSSRICGYNYKPLSPCAKDCVDFFAWYMQQLLGDLSTQLCGTPRECAVRCGCSPYTGTPRNTLINLGGVSTTRSVVTTAAPITVSSTCRRTPIGDCSWYRQCVEGHYPCSGTSLDVAVAFGEQYCKHLSTFSFAFSSTGKRWISAVQTCKQVKLYESVLSASLLSGLAPAQSCMELQEKVMGSFRQDCFIRPDSSQSGLGLCTLPCKDILAMMLITMGTVPEGRSYFQASSYRTALVVEGKIFQDIGTCVKTYRHRLQDLTCLRTVYKRVVRFYLKGVPLPKLAKKILSNPDIGLRVASAVVEKLEDAYSWAKKGVKKFFSGTTTSSSSSGRKRRSDSLPSAVDVTVTIMLTTEKIVNATIMSTDTSSFNYTSSNQSDRSNQAIEDAYNDVLQAVKTGSPILKNIRVPASDGLDSFTVTPSSMSECLDVVCDTTNANVTNVAYPQAHSGGTSGSVPQLLILFFIHVLLLLSFSP